MRAITDPDDYPSRDRSGITIYALNANARPIGFARDWPEEEPLKKKKRKKKAKDA
jgi:hypothetical protein